MRIVWTAGATHAAVATASADVPLASVLTAEDREALARKAAASAHPMFRLAEDVFVELPVPTWRGGDLLVYLPCRGWLVRRNKVEHWYVDIGVFGEVTGGLYAWTDLWLDVIAPEGASRYDLLDADEFAAALRDARMTAGVAAAALEQLDALLRCMRAGTFPPPEVRLAEAFASDYRAVQERRGQQ